MTTIDVDLTWMRNWPIPGTGQFNGPMRAVPGKPATIQGDPKVRKPSGVHPLARQSFGAQSMHSTVSLPPPFGVTLSTQDLAPEGDMASLWRRLFNVWPASPNRWP